MGSNLFTSVSYESMGNDKSLSEIQRLPFYQVSLEHSNFCNIEVLTGPGNVVCARHTN